MEETMKEVGKLTQAARYERNEQRQGHRSGHYSRNLTTTASGNVTQGTQTQGDLLRDRYIERYRRQESSVEETRRRTRVVGCFPDGSSALMLGCARLCHVAGTQWDCKKYINMKHLETALEAASIAG